MRNHTATMEKYMAMGTAPEVPAGGCEKGGQGFWCEGALCAASSASPAHDDLPRAVFRRTCTLRSFLICCQTWKAQGLDRSRALKQHEGQQSQQVAAA